MSGLRQQRERPVPPGMKNVAGLGQTNDRLRLFAEVLAVLTDDLFQLGSEAMALSLHQYATQELPDAVRREAERFASDLDRFDPADEVHRALYRRRQRAQQEVLRSARRIAAGLDALAAGRLPEEPVEFVSESYRLIEAVKRYVASQRFPALAVASPRDGDNG